MLKFEEFLENPEQNLFKDDMVRLKRDIDENYEKRDMPGIFFNSIDTKVNIAYYTSSFPVIRIWSSPINPMELSEGTPLKIRYQSNLILSLFSLVLFHLL